jgi:uncharacterized protein YdeI (YjbR/CyaY-like superfamily)
MPNSVRIADMNQDEALHLKDRTEWRKWLEQNSDRAQEVWLVHYKRHSDQISISHDEAVEEALCFGWIDGKLKSIDKEKYILRYSPRKANSVWSKINKDKAEILIAQGRMTHSGLAKIEDAKKSGIWDTAYTNKLKDKIPTDLEKALKMDPKAFTNFQKFANTYRNMYIGWVVGAKTGQTRRKRIIEVVQRSALNKKPAIE